MSNFSWVLDQRKFLSDEELSRLKRVLELRKSIAARDKHKTPVRDWFVLNLALYTGLRSQEISYLTIGDLTFNGSSSSLYVKRGKNGKPRLVKYPNALKKIVLEYFKWKNQISEPLDNNAPLVYSSVSKGRMSTRGIQKIFERNAKRADIKGHSIHHLRHTYASHLYKASGYNLRLVQKQLGHSSIRTTEVYADVLRPDLDRAVNKLYCDET